ncbi:DUF4380 domain-containing protein [Streptomyces sp. Rer75]|uniref:DUF4380 domain-containing protein n=1 Tax=Streptomyces sp. Rer75 TaxID=2750011 RepID=UPI0015D07769|nr:DUF4380 domain-containing protein [Streptomyces sp. Rer75]QLH26464.1 DUF4380 domain-containing protein [Streptomyces sp. Rer75]
MTERTNGEALRGDGVEVVRSPVGPYELVRLDAGAVQVTAVPALGGRLLSLTLHGREFLYRNERLLDGGLRPRPGVRPVPQDGPMSAWLNWGGDKTWPAPQGWDGPGQWAGPPDPVLDSGPYGLRLTVRGRTAQAVMTSGVEPRTGLRIERRVTVTAGRTAFTLENTLTNESDRPRRWAVWNVTQLAGTAPGSCPAGGVYVGTAGSGRPETVGLIAGTGRPQVHRLGRGVLHVPHQDVVGKVGFPDAAGWLAHVAPQGTLTQRFEVSPAARYPDGDSRVEVWLEHPLHAPLEHLGGLHPLDRVVECEALGPLQELAPGQSTRLTLEIGVGAGAGPVEAVTSRGFWSRLPRLEDGRLVGVFVPFRDGSLTARPSRGGGEPVRCGTLVAGEACAFDVRPDGLAAAGADAVVVASAPDGSDATTVGFLEARRG